MTPTDNVTYHLMSPLVASCHQKNLACSGKPTDKDNLAFNECQGTDHLRFIGHSARPMYFPRGETVRHAGIDLK